MGAHSSIYIILGVCTHRPTVFADVNSGLHTDSHKKVGYEQRKYKVGFKHTHCPLKGQHGAGTSMTTVVRPNSNVPSKAV